MSSVTSKSPEQGPTGSRLANLFRLYNPRLLFRREFYVSGFRGGVLTFVSVMSVLALYSVIAAVSVLNAIRLIRGRRVKKAAPKTPLDFELEIKTAGKPVEDVGINMDDVQEIPGEEVEFAAMKEVMPAPDQIPEINDEPPVDIPDEEDAVQAVMSDDETLIGHDEPTKGSPVIAPVPTIKDDVERPMSPPATPPTAAADAPRQPEMPVVDAGEEPPKPDNISEHALDMSATVEEAVKAVEDHAKIVEDAATPVESVDESSKSNSDSPVSRFAFVPVAAVEQDEREPPKPEDVPAIVDAVQVPTGEPEISPAIAEPATIEAPVPEIEAPEETAPAKPAPEQAILVDEPQSVEPISAPVKEPKPIEEPVEEPKAIEAPVPAEEPAEVLSPVEAPKEVFPSPDPSKPAREDSLSPIASSKSLRPRVMRRATGSTSAIAGVTTSPAPATVAVAVADEKTTKRDTAFGRANEALNMLAGSILRSNTSDRLHARSASPPPSSIPRPISPVPPTSSRSASPVNLRRSESSERAGSRPTSPSPGMHRRGSIANSARPTILRQPTPEQPASRSPPKKTIFTNLPRGGAASPPPMPLPPQRQGSVRGNGPQVPQAAVMSPSVLSRKATIDSNGSPGSPPRRPANPGPRSPGEEPFPAAIDALASPISPISPTSPGRPKPRARTSTSGSATSPTAPNTLQASLLATLGKVNFPGSGSNSSSTNSGPSSNPASPRADSFASAVSNRDSILCYSDMSDMDMSASDLDFATRESNRILGVRYDSMSSDGEMSGNEEEKRKKRAKRRAKARAQAQKKQKRAKRN